MKKLTRNELRDIKGGGTTPPGNGGTPPGGSGSGGGSNPNSICYYTSASCGDLCYDIGSTAPCSSQLAILLPSCHYTARQVQSCASA